jgi:hypothetical protein
LGAKVLSKCPFWSTKKERVSCNDACPLYDVQEEINTCPFSELLTSSDSDKSEMFYSQDMYLNYGVNENVIDY